MNILFLEIHLFKWLHLKIRCKVQSSRVFRNGGWKSLDGGADREPAVRKRMEEQFSGFTWNYFVEQVTRRWLSF